jgi:hypothetical protein
MKIFSKSFAICAAAAVLSASFCSQSRAGLTTSIDAAGVQASTVPGVTTETFDSITQGNYSTLSTAVGTLTSAGAFAILPGSSDGGAYGGANSTPYFSLGAQSGSADPVTLTFAAPQTYFGIWWAAADANNTLTFYSGGTEVNQYTTSSLFSGLSASYYGNPNNGQDGGEPFAYINFNATGGTTITSVVISNNGTTGTGFESDNWSIQSVPEPSSFVMAGTAAVIGGLALVRRRRRARSVIA